MMSLKVRAPVSMHTPEICLWGSTQLFHAPLTSPHEHLTDPWKSGNRRCAPHEEKRRRSQRCMCRQGLRKSTREFSRKKGTCCHYFLKYLWEGLFSNLCGSSDPLGGRWMWKKVQQKYSSRGGKLGFGKSVSKAANQDRQRETRNLTQKLCYGERRSFDNC